MRIAYVLLSPTFGMHQYTGDLAAQMLRTGHEVHVVTTAAAPCDRYPAAVVLHTPLRQRSTGFKTEGLHALELKRVRQCIVALQPDVVHFSGVHIWNPLLLVALRRCGLAAVHTLHDLDPHPGVPNGSLIRLWNRGVIAFADGLVVHGECYRRRLLAMGRSAATVLSTPLLHSFLPATDHVSLEDHMPDATFAPWSLYFGRFERYKGLDVMLNAQRVIAKDAHHRGMVLAGGGNFGVLWPAPLPQGVSVLNRHIDSDEGRRLFQTCGILVLPYTGATQSALPATAYAFGKPVIVSTSGALPEVVQAGVTGWVVPAGNAEMLADCLATALDNPNCLAAAGAAGRRWYEEERCRQRVAMVRFYSTIKNVN